MTIQEILGDDNPNDGRQKLNSNFTELDSRSSGLEAGLTGEVIVKLSNAEGDFDWRNPADAALKGDPGEGSGARWDPVLVATTANITLSGAQTIDGVSVVAGDRVLVKSQSTGSQNGIYVCASGAWARASDGADAEDFVYGKYLRVNSGTLYGGQFWALSTTGTIVVGTTSLSFELAPNLANYTDVTNKLLITDYQARDAKDSVRVATTAAGTLASSFENGDTVDGITLATNDRILIKNQASGSENGVYTVNASGAPTRAVDANTSAKVTPQMFMKVEEGTANGSKEFYLSNTGSINLGTTALTFAPLGGGHTIQDEGTPLTQRSDLDFQGSGVTAADDSGKTVVTIPGASAASDTTAGIVELATDAETQTGTDTSRAITPANLTARSATETRTGVVELATDAETQTGSDTARAITPANLTARSATETRSGVVELATDAETQTGTDTARAITPANLTARSATETRTGVVELATDAETQTGTDTARAITPANLTARSATETRTGVVELATDAETQTGTDTARAITPANLTARSATETRSGVAEIATQGETDTGTDDARIVTPLKLANYAGLSGEDAFSTTLASFTQPASSSTVSVQVDTAWMGVDQYVYIEGGGYYSVDTVTDATHVVLENLGYPGNAAPAATVSSPAKVSPAGIRGATGAGAGYDTVDENGTPLTGRTTLNFGTNITATDNSGASRTDVDVPSSSDTTAGVVELATDAETQTGTDTARAITPANLTARTATETRTGVVELATDAETQTGTDTARAITPANLTARSATETRAGIAEVATQGETDTGTDDTRMVSPAKLANYAGLYRTLVTLGSDASNSTSTYADVTGLSFAVTNGTVYRFEAIILYNAQAATTGSKWSVNGPASPTMLSYQVTNSSATTGTSLMCSTYDQQSASSASTVANNNTCFIVGIIQPSADGTFSIRFGSEAPGSNNQITAKTGSTLEYW